MGVDKDGKHAASPVGLDESHPAHVRCEVVDRSGARKRLVTSLGFAQRQNQILRAGGDLMPLLQRLDVDSTDCAALFEQSSYEVSTDEASAAGDNDQLLRPQERPTPSQGRSHVYTTLPRKLRADLPRRLVI